MKLLLALLLWLTATAAWAGTNLARNPSFEEGPDKQGGPAEWQASGDSRLVAQTLALDQGRDSRRCARLACTRIEQRNPACHAMICQMGIPVKRGKSYRVAFWARAQDIASEVVSLALSDTSVWTNCGLQDGFAPTAAWTRYEFVFRATRDCPQKSRFQIWFLSTGTLWLDDVVFEEAGADLARPGHVIPAGKHKNLIPNASFECGEDGWGSIELDRGVHWGGSLNRLFGQVDVQDWTRHGTLHIDFSSKNRPVSYFDYYELTRLPILVPMAANLGYLEVEPGKPYVLSADLGMGDVRDPPFRMDATDAAGFPRSRDKSRAVPARLAVRQFDGRTFERALSVDHQWDRYRLTFTPTSRWCYVMIGPDLREGNVEQRQPEDKSLLRPEGDTRLARAVQRWNRAQLEAEREAEARRGTLFVDAVQLEQGTEPTPFAPRDPVEFGISTGRVGNVAAWNDLLEIRLTVARHDTQFDVFPEFDLRLTDFFGNEVWHEVVKTKNTEGCVLRPQMGRQRQLRGFLRLHVRMTCGDVVSEKTMRLAMIPPSEGRDSRFGVNHAYPWPHLLDLSRKAGLMWVRDWSLKWQEVEPEKGRFSFQEADYQINRPLEHKLKVLALLPFPSSNWSSSAPADVSGKGGYPKNRERVAYAPRDLGEFENYVARTVEHYRDRVTWWQCFNEPLYTDYSLPRKQGYDGATYAKLVQAFAKAARRADPQCRVLAGIGALHAGQIMDDFEKFFAAGGLAAVDAVDIHHYPTIRPPEFVEDLLVKLNGLMDKHGGRKPIWLTEYGYYADDEPWSIPLPRHGFDNPLPNEQIQAEYAVRWATLMLANGVDKVFYHAGTCGAINRGSLEGVFYAYAGAPKKIYAAQAVMASLLTPATQFVKRLPLPGEMRGYLFRDGPWAVAVIWAPSRSKPTPVRITNDKLILWDLMGRPQSARQFTPSATPVYVMGELSDAAFAAALGAAK